jgi:aryl-alcohol dehydrogenase
MPALNYIGARPDGSRALSANGEPVASNFFGQSSFATHALTYEQNVVRLPDDIPFEVAAPLGCGVQTGVGSVLNVFRPEAGASIVIAGAGTVGLSAVMAAKIAGCAHIIVVEPHESRRALARELGATHVVDPAMAPNVAAAVRTLLPTGAAFALDTTGRPPVLEALLALLAPQGVLGCVGVPAPDQPTPGKLSNVLMMGHSIVGIIEGDSDPAVFLPRLMQFYREGKLPLS